MKHNLFSVWNIQKGGCLDVCLFAFAWSQGAPAWKSLGTTEIKLWQKITFFFLSSISWLCKSLNTDLYSTDIVLCITRKQLLFQDLYFYGSKILLHNVTSDSCHLTRYIMHHLYCICPNMTVSLYVKHIMNEKSNWNIHNERISRQHI